MQLLLLLTGCILVAGWDLIARRVPNNLLIVLAASQCVLLVAGRAEVGWLPAAVGLCAGLFGLLPFYLLRMMGAGDVKFAALIGLMCGPWTLFVTWVLASLVAGLNAAVLLSVRASPVLSIVNDNWEHSRAARFLQARRQGRRGIPYAAYLAGGLLYLHFVHAIPFTSVMP